MTEDIFELTLLKNYHIDIIEFITFIELQTACIISQVY
jgi:hypothetical protein